MENLKLKNFKENIKGKKVAVLGLGVSNIPAIKYLNKCGAYIFAHDAKVDVNIDSVKNLDNIEFLLGEKSFSNLEQMDYIFRSPGVKPFNEKLEKAVKSGAVLTSEIEEVINLAPCKIIGITGSAGKTTTTTLISKLLEKSGRKIWVGGNIGTTLFEKLDEMKKDDLIVLELSSFQLMTMKKSPNISIVTNIYQDHLDYHRSFEEYYMAKTNIFTHQKKGDVTILNLDDEFESKFKNMVKNANIREFSVKTPVENGSYYLDGSIYICTCGVTQKVIDVKDVMLKGMKNYLNICAAICATIDFINLKDIQEVLKEFKGVEHRLEFVDKIDGVEYYNDSISTTPGKASACLSAFDKKIIIIAGGYDKNVDYTDYGKQVVNAAKDIILMGDTKLKIKEAIKKTGDNNISVHDVENMVEAVKLAKKIAKNGDIVVMSPASASFDMYKNYKDRGNHFKELVKK